MSETESNGVRWLEVGPEQAGQRIDNFLTVRLKGVPKSRIYRILRKGEVRVNKGRIKPDYRLQVGDTVRVPPLRVAESAPAAAPGQQVLKRVEASILHEDRASPDAENGLSPTLYDDIHGHIGMSHSWGATGLRIAYAHTRLNYDDVRTATGVINNDDRDRNVDSFGARLTFQQDKWFQPFLQATANVRRYDHTPDDNGYVRNSRGDTVVLGVRTELAQLKGEVFGGRLYQRFDDAAFSNVSKPDFGANLSWTPVAKATVRLFASRALDETILSGASSYLYTRSGVGLDYRATERLTLSAGGSWNRVAYQEVARSDTIDTASVGASYAVTPTLKLVAAYDRVHRTSDTPLDNYRDNRWTLQVSAQF